MSRIRRRLCDLLLVVAAIGAGVTPLYAPPAPSPCVPAVPCTDPRGCPDLRAGPASLDYIEFLTMEFPPTDCSVIEGHITAGVRRLMIFDTYLPNLGAGDMILGDPRHYPGLFEFAACHGHYHMRSYAAYRLWTLDGYARWRDLRAANPSTCSQDLLDSHRAVAGKMKQGTKVGFCVIDVEDVCNVGIPWKYDDCDTNQGITAGWTDIYGAGTEGQWIDITDVAPGRYVFETEVNPLRLVVESDYMNNAVAKIVTVP